MNSPTWLQSALDTGQLLLISSCQAAVAAVVVVVAAAAASTDYTGCWGGAGVTAVIPPTFTLAVVAVVTGLLT